MESIATKAKQLIAALMNKPVDETIQGLQFNDIRHLNSAKSDVGYVLKWLEAEGNKKEERTIELMTELESASASIQAAINIINQEKAESTPPGENEETDTGAEKRFDRSSAVI
jgi:hypothetical protein